MARRTSKRIMKFMLGFCVFRCNDIYEIIRVKGVMPNPIIVQILTPNTYLIYIKNIVLH